MRLVALCLTDYLIDCCAGYDSVDSEMPELEYDSGEDSMPELELQMDLTEL